MIASLDDVALRKRGLLIKVGSCTVDASSVQNLSTVYIRL